MENKLAYVVIEYIPKTMSDRDMVTARMDGHYLYRKDAEGVARLWAEEPMHKYSRIVVAEIITDIKQPDYGDDE